MRSRPWVTGRRAAPRPLASDSTTRRCRSRPRAAGVRRAGRVRRRCTGWCCSSRPAEPRAGYALAAAAWRSAACSPPRGCRRARAQAGRRRRRCRRPRARAARRRRRRRAAAARPLGRARSGIGRGIAALPGRARALPRRRRVDADGDPASAARCSCGRRRAARSGRGARTHRLPRRRAGAARRRCTRSRPSRSTSRTSSCAARCWRCSCSRSCGSRSCGSPTPARRRCVAVGVAVLGADARRPRSTPTSRGATTRLGARTPPRRSRPRSRWDHDYGPLDWPRDGRELLRVQRQARPPTGRRTNLDDVRRRPLDPRPQLADFDGCDVARRRRRTIAARARSASASRSATSRRTTFVTAGCADAVDSPTHCASCRAATAPGRAPSRALRRGDAYTATSTRRRPTSAAAPRRRAGADRADVAALPRGVLRAGPADRDRADRRAAVDVQFPQFGEHGAPMPAPHRGQPAVGRRSVRRPARCAEGRTRAPRARAAARRARPRRQEDYVQAVLRYLRDGFAYTETPPRSASNLDGFLFDAKAGYCQQFSGAMALLLRMGGVPARVSTGFTSGLAATASAASTSCATSTPTRGSRSGSRASAGSRSTRRPPPRPPRRSPTRAASRAARRRVARRRRASAAATGRPTRGRRAAATSRARRWALIVLGGARPCCCRSPRCCWRGRRRRRRRSPAGRGPLAELERALRAHAAAPRPPGTTLQRARGDASPARPRPPATCARCASSATAAAPRAPTPRAAPRPARRAGPRRRRSRGRLRAWWALPAAPARVIRRLHSDLGGMDDVYDLFQRGTALLEAGDFHPPRCR